MTSCRNDKWRGLKLYIQCPARVNTRSDSEGEGGKEAKKEEMIGGQLEPSSTGLSAGQHSHHRVSSSATN